jgi:hypothetical protein
MNALVSYHAGNVRELESHRNAGGMKDERESVWRFAGEGKRRREEESSCMTLFCGEGSIL